jgi:hypothetical protein
MSDSVRCPRATPPFGGDLIDLYVDWREECVAVQVAYTWWSDAQSDERATAFAVYRAALDREEQASRVYADLISRVAVAAAPVSG